MDDDRKKDDIFGDRLDPANYFSMTSPIGPFGLLSPNNPASPTSMMNPANPGSPFHH